MEKVKLYAAILNRGNIRREVVERVIPALHALPYVDTTLERLSLSFDNPIFSNRNKIAQRMLNYEPKQDVLLLLDDDIVPFENVAELASNPQDIIGVPAKVRQADRSINWVAYLRHPQIEGYSAVDFDAAIRANPGAELLRVDAVGTGCILIKRHVLEAMFKKAKEDSEKLKRSLAYRKMDLTVQQLAGWNAPFTIYLDEYGCTTHGTDFAFCKRAKALGFGIYATMFRRCEHFKNMGLADISGYDDGDSRDFSTAKYDMPWGIWAIQQIDWEFIKHVMEIHGVKRVLEFGAGLSSLLMSERAKVVSFEEDADWAEIIMKKRLVVLGKFINDLEIKLWKGKQIRGVDSLGRFDLAFVDAPKGILNGGIGRQHSIRLAARLADRVIVHDAGRMEETKWQNKYLRYNGFNYVARNGHHYQRCQLWERKKLRANA